MNTFSKIEIANGQLFQNNLKVNQLFEKSNKKVKINSKEWSRGWIKKKKAKKGNTRLHKNQLVIQKWPVEDTYQVQLYHQLEQVLLELMIRQKHRFHFQTLDHSVKGSKVRMIVSDRLEEANDKKKSKKWKDVKLVNNSFIKRV